MKKVLLSLIIVLYSMSALAVERVFCKDERFDTEIGPQDVYGKYLGHEQSSVVKVVLIVPARYSEGVCYSGDWKYVGEIEYHEPNHGIYHEFYKTYQLN